MFADLHNHLYGSLDANLLFQIGRSNPAPKWQIFTDSYEKAYGQKILPEEFWKRYSDPDLFSKLYYFDHLAPFSHFQAKFNLIIALCKFDTDEIRQVASSVLSRHSQDGVQTAEYRILFPPDTRPETVLEKCRAACEGFRESESEFCKGRLVLSLHRDRNYEVLYRALKEAMAKESLLQEMVVGIDFCFVEEGYPPKDKKEFFSEILRDNRADPDNALSILYHVGESFVDKSISSASRWVLESAEIGAHRLGHAIAAGIDPRSYAGKTVWETASERLDQIRFYLERFEDLKHFMPLPPKTELEKEMGKIQDDQKVPVVYTTKEIERTEGFQNYCLDRLSKSNSIVEICPTSNERIGMIADGKHHPIHRFLKSGIKLTIATDDPGIFHTNIKSEYEMARKMGIPSSFLEKIQSESFEYVSEKLSFRTGWNNN